VISMYDGDHVTDSGLVPVPVVRTLVVGGPGGPKPGGPGPRPGGPCRPGHEVVKLVR